MHLENMRHHVTDDNLRNNKNKQHLVKVYLAPPSEAKGAILNLYIKSSNTHFTTENIHIFTTRTMHILPLKIYTFATKNIQIFLHQNIHTSPPKIHVFYHQKKIYTFCHQKYTHFTTENIQIFFFPPKL